MQATPQTHPQETPSNSPALPPITKRYLLVTNISCYCDEQGDRYLESMWHKDLIKHFKYLKNFTLASPRSNITEPPAGAIALKSDPSFANVQFVDLPAPKSFLQAIFLIPATAAKLSQAIAQSDIIHTGIAGWPIPLGWVVTPLVQLQRKFYLIIVESAFWRLSPGQPKKIQNVLRAQTSEIINRWCMNSTNLAIFTQSEYQKSLLTKRPERGHVIHASWIDEENIISAAAAKDIWQKKLSPSKPFKLLFAGRLSPDKGLSILLEAAKLLDQAGIPLQLDILGQGELFAECQAASQNLQKSVQIQTLGTVPYGPELFQKLQDYHAIVVPSRSDEQPRIVYDAYSQAIPVLASDTAGLRDCIENGKTGKLVKPNDPAALAELLKETGENLNQLETMGMAALEKARSLTHEEMHRKRWEILLKALEQSPA